MYFLHHVLSFRLDSLGNISRNNSVAPAPRLYLRVEFFRFFSSPQLKSWKCPKKNPLDFFAMVSILGIEFLGIDFFSLIRHDLSAGGL